VAAADPARCLNCLAAGNGHLAVDGEGATRPGRTEQGDEMTASRKAGLPAEALHLALSRARLRYGLAWDELAERLDISFRTLLRLMSAQTVTPVVADRMAVRLGLHPVMLWPDEWVAGAA
jgi:hypothetical protein